MNESLGETLAISFQRLLPFLSSVVLLFLSYTPIDSFFLNNLRPLTTIICVYFWLLYRPDIFNLGSVFILGFLEDVISAAPYGSSIAALLIVYVFVTQLSNYFNAKPFVVIWYGFVAICLGTLLSRWLLVSIYYGQFLPLYVLMFSFLSTIAFYPLISSINAFIENHWMKEA